MPPKKLTPEQVAEMTGGRVSAQEASEREQSAKTRAQQTRNFDPAPDEKRLGMAERGPGRHSAVFNASAKDGITGIVTELGTTLKDGLDRSRTPDSNTNRLIDSRMEQAEVGNQGPQGPKVGL